MNSIDIYTISLGCPKNLVDTENMLGPIKNVCRSVDDPQKAQVILINTCAFIQPAIEESLQNILEMVEIVKESNQNPLLVVTGCLVSRFGQELKKEIPEVDIFLPIRYQFKFPEILAEHLKRTGHSCLFQHSSVSVLGTRLLTTPKSFAYLKISEGCNNKCSFCTIPSIRGRLKSKPLDQIMQEAKFILDQGIKEIILVAQDSTAYGRDLGYKYGLRTLLDKLLSLSKLKWLRILYLYPAGLSQSLLKFLAGCGEPFVPYFDLPLQHAHPQILKSMGRPFARNPQEIIDRIRNYLPGAALRTTLIVGYPGETDEHFQTLCDFVKRNCFHHLGVFPYYPEQGTKAATLPQQVPDKDKKTRRDLIMRLQQKISARILAEYEGETIDVLVDRAHPEWPGLFVGRVWFQAPEIDGVTYISGPDIHTGSMVPAMIHEAKTYDLVALA
ncbi:30S ribosomal protein S12 methylthiotransferase RimO [Desulfovulcanus sp.]